MKSWLTSLFLALILCSLAGCAAGDGTYTGAPEQQPVEYQSPRP